MKRTWRLAVLLGALGVIASPCLAQAQAQTIKVHGHWVIEVRDAHGTLVRRREFDNALQDGGQRALAEVMTGTRPAGNWMVFVRTASGGLCSNGGTPSVCRIVEPGMFGADGWTFPNLTKTIANGHDIVFQGSFVVTNAGSATVVGTEIIPPGYIFTEKTLDVGIPVEATQTVSVTVTITFS